MSNFEAAKSPCPEMTRQPRHCFLQKKTVSRPSNRVQPLGDQLVTIIHDEYATHIPLDVVEFLLCLERIKKTRRCTNSNARNSSWPSTLKCFTERDGSPAASRLSFKICIATPSSLTAEPDFKERTRHHPPLNCD